MEPPTFARGFYAAADELMHFINALDSDGLDANAVRSAIYHKCLEMKPRTLGKLA